MIDIWENLIVVLGGEFNIIFGVIIMGIKFEGGCVIY